MKRIVVKTLPHKSDDLVVKLLLPFLNYLNIFYNDSIDEFI